MRAPHSFSSRSWTFPGGEPKKRRRQRWRVKLLPQAACCSAAAASPRSLLQSSSRSTLGLSVDKPESAGDHPLCSPPSSLSASLPLCVPPPCPQARGFAAGGSVRCAKTATSAVASAPTSRCAPRHSCLPPWLSFNIDPHACGREGMYDLTSFLSRTTLTPSVPLSPVVSVEDEYPMAAFQWMMHCWPNGQLKVCARAPGATPPAQQQAPPFFDFLCGTAGVWATHADRLMLFSAVLLSQVTAGLSPTTAFEIDSGAIRAALSIEARCADLCALSSPPHPPPSVFRDERRYLKTLAPPCFCFRVSLSTVRCPLPGTRARSPSRG